MSHLLSLMEAFDPLASEATAAIFNKLSALCHRRVHALLAAPRTPPPAPPTPKHTEEARAEAGEVALEGEAPAAEGADAGQSPRLLINPPSIDRCLCWVLPLSLSHSQTPTPSTPCSPYDARHRV